MKKVFLGIPSLGKRSDAQIYRLRELEKRYAGIIEFVWPKEYVGRLFHDHARNAMVEEFLSTDCDILWFLDSDIVPPPDCIELITLNQDNWLAAGLPYAVFITPEKELGKQVVYCIYNGCNGKSMGTANLPASGVEFVDGLATGCMFLKREVFSKLEKPYFKFVYDNESRDILCGEDLDFCIRLNALGIRFLTDYSKVCSHFKEVNLLEVNNYAMHYAKKTVETYSNNIKNDLKAALAEAYNRGKADAIANSRPVSKSSGLILPDSFKDAKQGGLVLP